MGQREKLRFTTKVRWKGKTFTIASDLYEQKEMWCNWWKRGRSLHNFKCMAAYGLFLTRNIIDVDSKSPDYDDIGIRYLYQAAYSVDLAAYAIASGVSHTMQTF